MKHLLLALLLAFTSTAALADSPEAILKDYRKASQQAVARLNQSLEKTTTALITKLVSSGDTAGAELLTSQMKAKMMGEPVMVPQASAVDLFALYDDARAKALAPVQKSSITRIDSLLKTAGGAKLETITELGKVRAEIEATGSIPAAVLTNNIPMHWSYHLKPDRLEDNGSIDMKPDGTLTMTNTNQSTPGKWSLTSKKNVVIVFFDTDKGREKCQMRINGNVAELERPIGTRYLKAK